MSHLEANERNIMREEMQKIWKVNSTFIATFSRMGYKNGNPETVLLTDILDQNGKQLSDHVWVRALRGFKSIRFETGDIIQFNAKVNVYHKKDKITKKSIEDYSFGSVRNIVKHQLK